MWHVAHMSDPRSTVRRVVDTKNHSLHRRHRLSVLAWIFCFYPLRCLTLFTSARASWIITFVQNFIISFRDSRLGTWIAGSTEFWIGGNNPPSRVMHIFLSPTSQTFLLFFPPPVGDHFSLFSDTLPAPLQTFVDAVALHLAAFIRRR
jgi:hypothetical protein